MGYSGIVTLFSDPPQPRLRPSTLLASMVVHGAVFSLLAMHVLEQHHVIERFPQTRFAVRVVDFHSKESQIHPPPSGGMVSHDSLPASKFSANPSSVPTSNGKPNQLLNQAQAQASAASSAQEDSEHGAIKIASDASSAPVVLVAGSSAAARLTPQRMPAPQTLLQPDLPQPILQLQKTPVPLVVLWKPEKVVPKTIVLPMPDRAAIAMTRPTLEAPIKEENLGDLRLSSSTFVTQGPAVRPSTTSPLVVKGPEETKKVPETTSKQPDTPTPSRLLSLSDTRVEEGRVTVPLANQTDKANAGKLIPGQLKSTSPVGTGESTSKMGDKSAGKGVGDRTEGKVAGSTSAGDAKPGSGNGSKSSQNGAAGSGKPAPGASAGSVAGSATGSVSGPVSGSGKESAVSPASPMAGGAHGADGGAGQAASAGSGANPAAASPASTGNPGNSSGPGVTDSSSTVHISLPKDGQFGVVVFGSSIAERYPETAEMWSGRMASTVYLRVGQPKSWILQYALPRLDDAANGSMQHIEAPWPYEIARPTMDPADLDADALILHGFVNKDGRFEKLEVVFPGGLAQAPRIERALNQWQFRPAKRNGQPIPVEVLLIVPDQSN